MIRPANYSIQIISRSDFDFPARFYSEVGGVPVDLSGNTILAQLWNRAREIKYGDFLVDTSRIAEGLLSFSLTADETITLPTTGVYDVKIIYSNGKEYYLLEGSFSVKRGYTDD